MTIQFALMRQLSLQNRKLKLSEAQTMRFLGNKENKWVFCNNYFVLLKAISFGKVSGKFVEDFHLLNLILDIYSSNNHIKKSFSSSVQQNCMPETSVSSEIMRKLCLSTKLQYQEIR